MTDPRREKILLQWVRNALNDSDLKLRPASSDASFRSYLRTECRGTSFVVMDAPPEKEDIAPWLDVAARLRAASLSAPEVLWVNREEGFILMSDLGETPFLDVLNADTADDLYRDAINAIFTMQSRVKTRDLPDYDTEKLQAELDLFPEWFLGRHLGLEISASERMIIGRVFQKLIDSALEQPQVFVHRDYHSRNLMRLRGGNPGIIDFQDAVRGPITYDLVSLLRDCYIEWPQERVLGWVNEYRERLAKNGMIEDKELRFKRWFDWMGVHRHIKVLGIFCRLCYRDGKPRYLKDLPLTLKYVLDIAGRNKDLGPFASWLRDKVGDTDITVPRS
jgi:aminoglycoside/choline kinase family phosphotransferase